MNIISGRPLHCPEIDLLSPALCIEMRLEFLFIILWPNLDCGQPVLVSPPVSLRHSLNLCSNSSERESCHNERRERSVALFVFPSTGNSGDFHVSVQREYVMRPKIEAAEIVD